MAVNRPALPMTGGCPCGAIRYEITLFPRLLYSCNCTDCQRASGSAFALNMPVLSRGFRILHGDPRGWHHRSPRGVEVTSRFCGDCGGRLYGERSGRAESLNLRAGTLDDTSWLMPVAQIFRRSAHPWVLPAVNAECHDTEPADFAPLLSAWRAMWPEFFPQE